MLPSQREVETFLLSDICVGLSNVRFYLQWSGKVREDAVVLSRDNSTAIITRLLRMEEKARFLAQGMAQEDAIDVGVAGTLQRLTLQSVA